MTGSPLSFLKPDVLAPEKISLFNPMARPTSIIEAVAALSVEDREEMLIECCDIPDHVANWMAGDALGIMTLYRQVLATDRFTEQDGSICVFVDMIGEHSIRIHTEVLR